MTLAKVNKATMEGMIELVAFIGVTSFWLGWTNDDGRSSADYLGICRLRATRLPSKTGWLASEPVCHWHDVWHTF
jgi:hypothetical protein